MQKITNAEEWLMQPPKPEEVKEKDGGKYLPYNIIVQKLYILCGHDWSTHGFQESYVIIGKKVLVSGNIEVAVSYQVKDEDGDPRV